MNIRPAAHRDDVQLIRLIGEFRVALAGLRGNSKMSDVEAAEAELAEYQRKGYPVFVAEDHGSGLVGYLVCRVDGECGLGRIAFCGPKIQTAGDRRALYALG